jgi:AraC family transcriptional regulator
MHLAAQYATGPAAGGAPRPASRGGLPAPRLRRVRDYVQAHLGGVLRVDDLAREAGLSRWHFSRAFLEATGETPACYVRRARLEYAARLLRTTARPVLQVAYEAGFESPSHLTALFRRYLGVPPGAYRAAARRGARPE